MKGKTALITGSTRGIGRSIALELASRGCDILLHGMEDPAQTLEEIQKKGVKAAFVQGNVADYESCRKMAEEAQKHFKQIDILVNNAGITMDRTLKKMTPDEWNKVISVNLGSMYNVTSTVLPLIPDGGRIISISSIAGRTGNFGQTNYAASKAGGDRRYTVADRRGTDAVRDKANADWDQALAARREARAIYDQARASLDELGRADGKS